MDTDPCSTLHRAVVAGRTPRHPRLCHRFSGGCAAIGGVPSPVFVSDIGGDPWEPYRDLARSWAARLLSLILANDGYVLPAAVLPARRRPDSGGRTHPRGPCGCHAIERQDR
jgi:hypothetical protein